MTYIVSFISNFRRLISLGHDCRPTLFSQSFEARVEHAINHDWPALFGNVADGVGAPWEKQSRACRAALASFVAAADSARDTGRTDEAARAYHAAAALAPWRLDLRLQLGNMLKDSGLMPHAEETYRGLIAEAPTLAEAHLQLGHVLKLVGRRVDAMSSYREAIRQDIGCEAAHRELFLAGETDRHYASGQRRGTLQGFDDIAHMASKLQDIRSTLDDLSRKLPDIAAFLAWPIDDYAAFRHLHDIPPPPALRPEKSVLLIIPQAGIADDVVVAQVAAVAASRHVVGVFIIGAAQKHRACWDAVDGVIGFVRHVESEDDIPDALAAPYLVRLAPGRIPHAQLAAWSAVALGEMACDLIFCDEESIRRSRANSQTFEAYRLTARPAVDPLWLEQCDSVGETLGMRADVWPAVRKSDASRRVRTALAQGMTVSHVPYPLVSVEENVIDAPLRGQPEIALPAPFSTQALPARVTAILCTRDNGHSAKTMVDSLFTLAAFPQCLEVIIVDNGSVIPEHLAILDALGRQERVTLLRDERVFNWSALNNMAATRATTEHLLFCNDDMAMLSDGWDSVLDAILRDESTGAVGAKLLYKDGTMQHAGVLLGWQGSVIHDGLYEPQGSAEQLNRWQVTRQCSAVTGAWLGVRASVFREAGGFNAARMPVAYSDIDFCLRLGTQGKAIVWTPMINVRHDESVSRGLDHLDPLRHASRKAERAAFEQIWGAGALACDPSVNPVWADATLPWRLIAPVHAEKALAWIAGPGRGFLSDFGRRTSGTDTERSRADGE